MAERSENKTRCSSSTSTEHVKTKRLPAIIVDGAVWEVVTKQKGELGQAGIA